MPPYVGMARIQNGGYNASIDHFGSLLFDDIHRARREAPSEQWWSKMYCVYWRECMFAFVCRQQIALTYR